ncbi:MAG: hypothetical protein COV74_03290 [Candidatus Omnitrophica bacterium CG11_big_fil_rev_8_21_14_0_20_45_26]|uniref:DUF2304 domain-containing protein n=1 Tax=Candidatus Abzuiibacterium crystallinum TaxID=1974748 RepID=A0A2H0LR07_9BACT|nr:MAG: hypothetical protein COV74_03290 [Candidatus Omnitrophica bacterium CG11_big_fil_rev_8_21_14_0_20_45_26]PIW64699.1 MAG: hypothetical protein COW12_05315 [Candidatus Omnitrophica bacterium CG12_big_fil_rev_8_21_14_0_65_45_16]
MNVNFFAILSAFLILCLVIELIRQQKMTFKYSLSWLSASLLVIILAFNEKLLAKISTFFGFELLSNFIFFLLLLFFVFLSLRLTIFINEQNNRSETLAQTVGILEHKINELEKKTH